MPSFNTQSAMDIISHSTGGFSYDTLARALILKGENAEASYLLDECKAFCLHLEKQGILRRCCHCKHAQDEYFEYISH